MTVAALDRDARACSVILGRWPVRESDVPRLRRFADRGVPLLSALQFAADEGTQPLAIAVLQASIWEALSPRMREGLQELRRAHAAYIAIVVHTQWETIARLAEAGIAALAFKGPAMAWRLFGHHGRRPAGDIDLLLPTDQLEAAVQLLIADGRYGPRPPFDQPAVRAQARSVTVDPIEGADHLPEFDLHRSFAEPWVCALPAAAVREHASVAALGARPVPCVDDVLGALQGAIHLSANGYTWKQAVDLAGWDRVLAAEDRAALQAMAREAGCEGITLHAFELVRAVFGDPKPHAPPPLPGPSPTARARAALLRECGAVPEALFTPSPLRTGYVRTLVRNLAADRRTDAVAAMARTLITPNPLDAATPGAWWRRPGQVATRLLRALGHRA